jgi:hypothetical protein
MGRYEQIKKLITKNFNIIRTAVSLLIISIVGYFIFETLQTNWHSLNGHNLVPGWLTVIATVLFAIAVMASGILWGNILSRLSGKEITKTESVKVQIGSWLLKYIPGQVGSFASKLIWGSKNNFKRRDITTSFVYENMFLISTSIFTTLPILGLMLSNQLRSNTSIFLPLILSLPLILINLRPVFKYFANRLLKLLKKEPLPEEYLLSSGELFKQQMLFILPRFINAAGFVLIASSITTITLEMYLVLGATYVLAGIIGILAIFVPSGIGVREGVIILLGSVYLPVEVITLIALLARFYATVADILLGGVYYWLLKIKKGI